MHRINFKINQLVCSFSEKIETTPLFGRARVIIYTVSLAVVNRVAILGARRIVVRSSAIKETFSMALLLIENRFFSTSRLV